VFHQRLYVVSAAGGNFLRMILPPVDCITSLEMIWWSNLAKLIVLLVVAPLLCLEMSWSMLMLNHSDTDLVCEQHWR